MRAPYTAKVASRSLHLPVRGLSYHLRIWGQPQAEQAPIFLLHGWMDVAASWQLVVDALALDGHIIAPDWRGFGGTRSGQDSFYFPDYLGDLDALIEQIWAQHPEYAQQASAAAPSLPRVDLVGHSMGAHAALLYAAARPGRVRRLVNMEGFGAPPTQASAAPVRYGQWLDQLAAWRAGRLDLAPYADLPAVAARLMKTNPRIPPDFAHWLAPHWAEQGADGQWRILGEAAHKIINPVLFRQEEVEACYRAITCPVLTLLAEENRLHEWEGGGYSLADYLQRLTHLADNRVQTIAQAGHMLHHDQAAEVARQVRTFLLAEA